MLLCCIETRYGRIEMEYGTMKAGYDAIGAYDNVIIKLSFSSINLIFNALSIFEKQNINQV